MSNRTDLVLDETAAQLDRILAALTPSGPQPVEAWAKVHYAAPPDGWPGLSEHDGEDEVTLASTTEIVASKYYPITSYKIENGVVSIYLSPFNEVVAPGENGDWWEVFTIDSERNVTASGIGTTEAHLVYDSLPEFSKYAIVRREAPKTDSNGNYMYEDGHEGDWEYMLMYEDKCLLGYDANDNITLIKQTSEQGMFRFSLTLPEKYQSFWDDSGPDLDQSEIDFFTIDSEYQMSGIDAALYGWRIEPAYEGEHISTIGEGGASMVWGDSDYPSVYVDFVSRADAEAYFNS